MRAIEAKNLRKAFTAEALSDVSFSVDAGEIVGVVGENGAGKSTLLNIISGIYQRYEGDVAVSGRVIPITGLAGGLKDRLTMRDNIFLTTALYGYSTKEAKTMERDIVAFANLAGYEATKLFQFSTGMMARLIFSIAVHMQPSVLLLDEVTSNLDQGFVQVVKDTLHTLTKKGVAILVVSHTEDIIRQCDRALVLKKGRIIMEGSGSEIANTYFV